MRRYLSSGVLAFCVFLGFVLWLNCWTPFYTDDYGYGIFNISGGADSVDRLGSLLNVWLENWRDGHRPIVHFFVRAFAGVTGKSPFNICNTAMLGLLIMLVLRLAKGTWSLSFRPLVLTAALVYLILCKGESYLWCSGSLNYLWAGCGMLAFLLVRERLEQSNCSWTNICVLSVPLVLFGWAQEAFSMPICFALGFYYLFNVRTLNSKKICAFLLYGFGAALLAYEAAQWMDTGVRSASMTQDFSLMKLVLNCLKIIVTVKALWLVVILLPFSRDYRGLLRRNVFELLVVTGSILMIFVVGFNGERSLWPANLASIVVFVREFDSGKWLSRVLAICLLVVLGCNSVLAVRIWKSFDRFKQMYLGSEDGVTIHERVNCGPFARFFFQSIYTWQTTGSAPMFFARYHGRLVPPKALTEEMYDTLYVRDEVCVSKNRMPVAGDFYTTSTINAIVSPIPDLEIGQVESSSAFVEYAPPHGLIETIRRNLAQSNPPPVCDERHPVALKTSHGTYLLISKRTGSEGYIKGVALKDDDAKQAN